MSLLAIVVLVVLVLALVGGLPVWTYSRDWGYQRSGIVGLVLIVVLLWVFFGDARVLR